jgi:large subunit ribosomal protein L25
VSETALAVELRESGGKGIARKLRAKGRIPGTCYGRDISSASISLDPAVLVKLLTKSEAGINTLIDLSVEGGGDYDGRKVLVKELQRDPVSGHMLHADLYAVDLSQTIHVSVPIHLTGIAEGSTMGGIVDHALRELEVECLPMAIPREFLVEISALDIGDSLHVRDISLPAQVTLVSDADLSVVSVMNPIVEEEPAAGEEAEEGAEAEGEAPSGDAASADAGGDESKENS